MPLDKAIKYGKEKRKPYYGAKAVSGQCRNHGGCQCNLNKNHKDRKRKLATDEQMREVNHAEWNRYRYLCS